MSRVIDYAWGRPSYASLRAEGAIAVCRYLAFPGSSTDGKRLSVIEAAGLVNAGFGIVSNWEQAGSWAEYSGGFNAGVRHATEAAHQHIQCGGPPDRPIYFSADFDATPSQLPVIADYHRGVSSVIGLARNGAYGGYRAIKYLFDAGVIHWGWQTYAWSAGQWDSRVHLRQVQNGVLIGGVDCDRNNSMTADFGQWGIRGSSMELTTPVPSVATPDNPTRDLNQTIGDMWKAIFLGLAVHGTVAKVDQLVKDFSEFKSDQAALLKLVAQLAADDEVDVQNILDAIAAMTHIDEHELAGEITAGLIASNANGLTSTDHEAVRADVLAIVNEVLNRIRITTEVTP